jgi:hypothetical protein
MGGTAPAPLRTLGLKRLHLPLQLLDLAGGRGALRLQVFHLSVELRAPGRHVDLAHGLLAHLVVLVRGARELVPARVHLDRLSMQRLVK